MTGKVGLTPHKVTKLHEGYFFNLKMAHMKLLRTGPRVILYVSSTIVQNCISLQPLQAPPSPLVEPLPPPLAPPQQAGTSAPISPPPPTSCYRAGSRQNLWDASNSSPTHQSPVTPLLYIIAFITTIHVSLS